MTEQNLIHMYVNAPVEKRVDIIIKNYPRFMGIVDGYTEGLRYMIECEKESNRRQEMGELGVRVQKGGHISDPTANRAIRNVVTREAIINCEFTSDFLEGIDRAEIYIRDAYALRDMRRDFNLFNSQLNILGTEKKLFTSYIQKERPLGDIAAELGITYESLQQRLLKSKLLIKKQVIGFMNRQLGGIA